MAKAKKQTSRASHPKTSKILDPVIAAITDHKAKRAESYRLFDELDAAESKAEKRFGRRPWSLIAWRNYTAIGGEEIDNLRDALLFHAQKDPKVVKKVNAEYRDAKRREREAELSGIEWDLRAGTKPFRNASDAARKADYRALERLCKTKPTTPRGAALFVSYVRRDIECGTADWHDEALATIARGLVKMGAA